MPARVICRSSARSLAILCVFLAFLTHTWIAVAQVTTPAQTTSKQPLAEKEVTAAQAIPLPEIIARIEELERLLRDIGNRLDQDPSPIEIDRTLRAKDDQLSQESGILRDSIEAGVTPAELTIIGRDWQTDLQRISSERAALTNRAKELEDQIRLLDSRRAQGEATLGQMRNYPGISEVTARVTRTFGEIQAVRSRVLEHLNGIVSQQNRLSQQSAAIEDALETISKETERLQRSRLEADSPPLWRVPLTWQTDEVQQNRLRKSLRREFDRFQQVIATKQRELLGGLAVFMVALLAALRIKGRVRSSREADLFSEGEGEALQQPFALAVLASLLLMIPLLAGTSVAVRGTLTLLMLIPVFRISVPLTKPVFRPLLYTLLVFGFGAGLWEMLWVWPAFRRQMLFVLTIAAIAVAMWSLRPVRLNRVHAGSTKLRILVFAIRAALAILLASALANLLGYVALGNAFRVGAVLSSYFAVTLYTAYRVSVAIFSWLLLANRADQGAAVRQQGEAVVRWVARLLVVVAFFYWLYGSLNLLAIRDKVMSVAVSVLSSPIKVGTVSISLGDVLIFALVLSLGFIVANVIRFLLQENILPRTTLKRGLPYTISALSYYILLLAAFLTALAAAGVELSQFAILTGAFGVGVGFGLQTVIANLAAGVLLLFERLISTGDIVEVGGLIGEVKRIGIRSSTVRTFQGAEVIVPNSKLVADQVINWTLSERRRRVDLQVGVAFGNEAEQVLKLLTEVAAANPDVVRDPAPVALFIGFGD
ncbi:MAG TPA: mechanosensitive ion channel domain-containing protein, partial [Blastocatellia bacterium]|nr:mechanosensitive ion channel domain-containing protein [Blastocatellia bacterium]